MSFQAVRSNTVASMITSARDISELRLIAFLTPSDSASPRENS